MKNFHGNDPITWIFHMDKLFYLYQVPTLQKVTIVSLYVEPDKFMWYQQLCDRKNDSIVLWFIFYG
jgi:hypothetical protein